ncbi:MAG: hypothetical protein QGH33_20140, partial [Pirellulaceae bacterium]|nr:hypothetical protein [Pirellulaceae bacterium]
FNLVSPDTLAVWITLDADTVKKSTIHYVTDSCHKFMSPKLSGVRGNSYGLADPSDLSTVREFYDTFEPADSLIYHHRIVV